MDEVESMDWSDISVSEPYIPPPEYNPFAGGITPIFSETVTGNPPGTQPEFPSRMDEVESMDWSDISVPEAYIPPPEYNPLASGMMFTVATGRPKRTGTRRLFPSVEPPEGSYGLPGFGEVEDDVFEEDTRSGMLTSDSGGLGGFDQDKRRETESLTEIAERLRRFPTLKDTIDRLEYSKAPDATGSSGLVRNRPLSSDSLYQSFSSDSGELDGLYQPNATFAIGLEENRIPSSGSLYYSVSSDFGGFDEDSLAATSTPSPRRLSDPSTARIPSPRRFPRPGTSGIPRLVRQPQLAPTGMPPGSVFLRRLQRSPQRGASRIPVPLRFIQPSATIMAHPRRSRQPGETRIPMPPRYPQPAANDMARPRGLPPVGRSRIPRRIRSP